MERTDFVIDLPVRAEWANVERVRASVGSLIVALSGDVNASKSVALVTAELAENAIKHGHWTEGPTTFRVRVWGLEDAAHVRVESPIEPGTPPSRLFETLRFIASFASAAEAYRARVAEIAAMSEPPAGGLGLVRLAYEASCTMTTEIDGDVLKLTADIPIGCVTSIGGGGP